MGPAYLIPPAVASSMFAFVATTSAALSAAAAVASLMEYRADDCMDVSFYASMLSCATCVLAVLQSNMSTRRLHTHTRKFAPSGMHGKANHTRDVRMYEDFGFLKGTAFDFSKEWEDQAVLSEANTEKELNKDGLRYRMAPTEKEKMETGRTGGAGWANIWEALGFTASMDSPDWDGK